MGRGVTSPRPGLRERKKARTRDALLRAALELFTTQGFEETTVDEITEAVDVSQRTFFRYFRNKEEVVFAVQDMIESHFVAALRERPRTEGPLEALRNAVLQTWDTVDDTIDTTVPMPLHMRTYQMIESTPPCSPAMSAAPRRSRSRWRGSSRNARAWTSTRTPGHASRWRCSPA